MMMLDRWKLMSMALVVGVQGRLRSGFSNSQSIGGFVESEVFDVNAGLGSSDEQEDQSSRVVTTQRYTTTSSNQPQPVRNLSIIQPATQTVHRSTSSNNVFRSSQGGNPAVPQLHTVEPTTVGGWQRTTFTSTNNFSTEPRQTLGFNMQLKSQKEIEEEVRHQVRREFPSLQGIQFEKRVKDVVKARQDIVMEKEQTKSRALTKASGGDGTINIMEISSLRGRGVFSNAELDRLINRIRNMKDQSATLLQVQQWSKMENKHQEDINRLAQAYESWKAAYFQLKTVSTQKIESIESEHLQLMNTIKAAFGKKFAIELKRFADAEDNLKRLQSNLDIEKNSHANTKSSLNVRVEELLEKANAEREKATREFNAKVAIEKQLENQRLAWEKKVAADKLAMDNLIRQHEQEKQRQIQAHNALMAQKQQELQRKEQDLRDQVSLYAAKELEWDKKEASFRKKLTEKHQAFQTEKDRLDAEYNKKLAEKGTSLAEVERRFKMLKEKAKQDLATGREKYDQLHSQHTMYIAGQDSKDAAWENERRENEIAMKKLEAEMSEKEKEAFRKYQAQQIQLENDHKKKLAEQERNMTEAQKRALEEQRKQHEAEWQAQFDDLDRQKAEVQAELQRTMTTFSTHKTEAEQKRADEVARLLALHQAEQAALKEDKNKNDISMRENHERTLRQLEDAKQAELEAMQAKLKSEQEKKRLDLSVKEQEWKKKMQEDEARYQLQLKQQREKWLEDKRQLTESIKKERNAELAILRQKQQNDLEELTRRHNLDLETKRLEAEKQNSGFDRQITDLMSQKTTYEESLTKMRTQLQNYQTLQQTNQDLLRQHNEDEFTKRRAYEDMQAAEKKYQLLIKSSEEQLQKLRNEQIQVKQELEANFKLQMTQYEEEMRKQKEKALADALANYRLQLDQAERENEGALKKMQSDYEAQISQIRTSHAQTLKVKEDIIKQLEADRTSWQAELNNLRQQNQQLTQEKAMLKSQYENQFSTLQTEITGLRSQIQQNGSTITGLRNQLSTSQNSLTAKMQEYKNLQAQLAMVKNQLGQQTIKSSQLLSQQEQLKQRLKTIQQEHQKNMQEKDEKIRNLQVQLAGALRGQAKWKAHSEASEKSFLDLEKKLKDLTLLIEQYKANSEMYRLEKEEHSQTKAALLKLQGEYRTLEQQYQEQVRLRQSVEAQLSQLQSQMQNKDARIAQLERDNLRIQQLEQEKESLRLALEAEKRSHMQDVEQLVQKVKSTESTLTMTQQQLAASKQQLEQLYAATRQLELRYQPYEGMTIKSSNLHVPDSEMAPGTINLSTIHTQGHADQRRKSTVLHNELLTLAQEAPKTNFNFVTVPTGSTGGSSGGFQLNVTETGNNGVTTQQSFQSSTGGFGNQQAAFQNQQTTQQNTSVFTNLNQQSTSMFGVPQQFGNANWSQNSTPGANSNVQTQTIRRSWSSSSNK